MVLDSIVLVNGLYAFSLVVVSFLNLETNLVIVLECEYRIVLVLV